MAAPPAGSLTIFFPCYNDAGTIGSLVAGAHVVGTDSGRDFEIVVVDDGSRDHSAELLEELRSRYPELRVVYHGTNRGYGAALRSGFSAATKELVFYTDGDGQYDVLELKKLLPVVQDGVDVVNGYKISRSDPWHRIVIGKVYLVLMRLLFQFRVRDVDCDFRLMRRSALETVELKHSSGVICLELVKKLERAGFRFVDFPVHHYHRVHGRSQFFNVPRLFATGVNILKLWWELNVVRDTPVNVAGHAPPRPGLPAPRP
ncbi:MAG TPA: glycosyltransferase family 2 protein [Thermoanaerobaculia bacterium]|nr:glycosyltransferase family 2 protein [Thermoanaerobaculia bacterium]